MERSDEPHPPQPGGLMGRMLGTPARVYGVFAAYFILQLVIRLVTSGTADLDESEQLLATQRLEWGYGPQPPLYTWLQFPLIRLFGPAIFPLALLKNSLLFCLYALTYLNARNITRSHWQGVLAAVSLLFLPQVAWESQRDLTHSVLVTVFAAATFHLLLRLNQDPRGRWYLALGTCLALGLLSKYSYAVFLLGLLSAAMTLPSLRAVVWNRGMLAALAVGVVLAGPHVVWAIQHPDWVVSSSGKFHIGTSRPWLETTLAGTGRLLAAAAAHVGALLAIYAVVCWKRPPGAAPGAALPDTARVIGRALVAMGVILLAGVLFIRVTNFRERWFLPLFVWLPVLLVAMLGPRLTASRMKKLIGIGGAVALTVSILIPARIWLAAWNRPLMLNMPFERLAAELRRSGPPPDCIVAQEHWIAGNLKLQFPRAFVASPRVPLPPRGNSGDGCLLVWDATRAASPPDELLAFASRYAEVRTNAIRHVEAPLKFHPGRPLRLGLAEASLR